MIQINSINNIGGRIHVKGTVLNDATWRNYLADGIEGIFMSNQAIYSREDIVQQLNSQCGNYTNHSVVFNVYSR